MKTLMALILLAGCNSTPECAPGKAGCVCIADSCDTGLACVGGSCRDEARVPLSVDSSARACEVVLGGTGGTLSRLVFGGDVKGKWLRQGDKLAGAFHSASDAPIGSVEVAYVGGFAVVNSRCYGADGVELPGVQVKR